MNSTNNSNAKRQGFLVYFLDVDEPSFHARAAADEADAQRQLAEMTRQFYTDGMLDGLNPSTFYWDGLGELSVYPEDRDALVQGGSLVQLRAATI